MYWKMCIFAAMLLITMNMAGCTEKESAGPDGDGDTTYVTLVVRDMHYAERTRYDLGRLPIHRSRTNQLPEPDKYDFIPGTAPALDGGDTRPDSIRKLIVFIDDNSADSVEQLNRFEGRCYIDPEDTLSDDPDGLYCTTGYFEIMEPFDYYFDQTNYYIQFLRFRLGVDDILAVYMEVERRRNNETYIDTVGDISSDPYRLKLIKPNLYLDINNHIWEYQWRNIYDMRFDYIDFRYLEVYVEKGTPISITEPDPDGVSYDENGIPYIQILGLDQGEEDLNPPPDGLIDRYARIDPVLGLLIFPARHPFDSERSFLRLDGTGQPVYPPDSAGTPLLLSDSVPEIYLSNDLTTLYKSSTYYLVIRHPAVQ